MRLSQIIPSHKSGLNTLRFCPSASCGWPSPALDWEEAPLSLDSLVGIKDNSNLLAWVTENDLCPSGISVGDLLVINCALDPVPGDVVLVTCEGEHYLRRLAPRGQAAALLSEQPGVSPLLIGEDQHIEIKGVVGWNLHRLPGAEIPAGICDSGLPITLDELTKAKHCSTFLARASGKSMINAGIRPGDILVVDRSCEPLPGFIIVAIVEGQFTVKRLSGKEGSLYLEPSNPEYEPIALKAEDEPELWGTVVWNLQRIALR